MTFLEPLGVSEEEERVYRAFLRDPAATFGELSLAAGVGRSHVRRLLLALEMKGLVSRSEDRDLSYVPIAPEMAVERLIEQRLEELERIRDAVPDLRWECRHPAERGNPTSAADGPVDAEVEHYDAQRQILLTLMTAGLTDETIALQLGISVRTVRRRIRRVMDELGVVTRFQAGLQAAKRGWI
jgi:DNA-binding NarL/FixJ family response regulator